MLRPHVPLLRMLKGKIRKKFFDFSMMLAHPFWTKYREPPPPLQPADLFRHIHWDPISIIQLTLQDCENGQASTEELFQAVAKFRYPNGTRIFNKPEVFANTVKAMMGPELGLLTSTSTSSSTSSSSSSSSKQANSSPSSSLSPTSAAQSTQQTSQQRQQQPSQGIIVYYSLTEKAKQDAYEPSPSFIPRAHHRIQPLPPEPFHLTTPKRLPPLPEGSEFQFMRAEWEYWDRVLKCWAGPQAEKRYYNPPFHIESGIPEAPKRKSWEWYANHHGMGPKPFYVKYGKAYAGRKNLKY